MRKFLLLLCLTAFIFTACSKKTRPAKSTETNKVVEPPKQASPVPVIPPVTAKVDSVEVEEEETTAAIGSAPMIVIDGEGNVITTKDKLPADIASKTNYAGLARAFTPEQKKNLIYRYKIVPPKVLYVPQQYISSSAKGKYIVYRKKFWYWQKKDGLFYLDETYYR